MPAQTNHLLLRGSTWHARIDIPADLRPAFGNRRILSKSLRTGDKRHAQELVNTQVGQWKAEFRAIREAKIRVGDQWREELARAAEAHHNQTNEILLSSIKGTLGSEYKGVPLDELREARDEVRGQLEQLAQTLGIPDALSDWDAIIANDGVHETERLNQLRDAQLLTLVQGAQNTWLLKGGEIGEAQAIAKDPSTYKPKSPISASAQNQFASYLAEQNDNQRTRDIYLSHIKRFSNWLTTNGRELTFDTVADYLNSVSKARQTRLGHLAALRKLHRWAVRYDAYYRDLLGEKRSPFEGHEHPKVGANAGKSWAAYSRQEAEQLHAAALAKDDTDLADLIAFACYTGCRIEELGRIRQETTIFDSAGQPVGFRVDESKTESGIREIPLHPALLPIYTRRLQKPQGDTLALFPGNDETKHGIRLNSLSQRFTKLKRQEGFGDQHVFHSLRKCTATMLQQAGVSPLTIPFLLGHDVGNVTFDVYSAGPTFEQKKEAIEKLEFKFSHNLLSHNLLSHNQ